MKTKKHLLIILIFVLCWFCLFSYVIKLDPEEHFKKYILNPIPKSVKNIKVDQTMSFYGYAYLFGFDIDKEDLKLIIDSQSLTSATYIDYALGCFDIEYHFKDYDGLMIRVYGDNKPARWFHPKSLKNPDCYCYITEINNQNDRRILLFNKEENKAYFFIEKRRN
jgi:hypothetical protein